MKENMFELLFEKSTPIEIYELIKDEPNLSKAIVLTYLDTDTSSKVLNEFDAVNKIELAIRISNLKNISPAIVRNIAMILENKMTLRKNEAKEISNVQRMAEILSKMGEEGEDTLNLIKMYDENLAQKLRDLVEVKEA